MMAVLLNSALPLFAVLFFLFVLMVSMWQILLINKPMPAYEKLVYHSKHWVLHNTCGKQLNYEQAQIVFSCGLLILLRLQGTNCSKLLILFTDQLTEQQFRFLTIMKKTKQGLS